MKKIPRHLGGHANMTHIDEGALIYLKHTFNVCTMVDVGCSVGGMIPIANKYNIDAIGIDGDYIVKRLESIEKSVVIHDYTTGNLNLDTYFDISWCVEFLEHIEEKFLSNVFDTFKKSKYVFCTASVNGGHHHVNVKPLSYWIEKFKLYNFEYLKVETDEIKIESTMRRNFVRDTGMIFKNNNI